MDERPRPFFVAATGDAYRHPKQAGAASIVIHAGVIALLYALAGASPAPTSSKQHPWRVTRLVMPHLLAPNPSEGGGGGGGRAVLPASRGQLPSFADHQFVPPRPVDRDQSFALVVEPTLIGPSDVSVPKIDAKMWGDPSALPGPPSPGRGDSDGIGDGHDGGVGPGKGPGWGPGEVGYGGAFFPGKGGVSAPVPLYQVDPEYSEEARKAKFQGTVVLEIVIDERGYPTNFKIPNPLGLGLDQKAVEAVRQWRFRPGMKNGKPVAVVARIEVNFRLL
jgi:TonB family protein